MIVIVRGGGDLASGVAFRLHRSGFNVVITELAQPLALRRTVSFAEAVYAGHTAVEGITASLVSDATDMLSILNILSRNQIPVLIDPTGTAISLLHPTVVVDGRMLKQPVELMHERVSLVIGLGPGFEAGVNCHTVIETRRGHTLGRVYWQGSGLPDTGIPEGVSGKTQERVLRSPSKGIFSSLTEIGVYVDEGQKIAQVGSQIIKAPFKGVLRGLLHSGLEVSAGMKVGDVDPRHDSQLYQQISDKALAVGGGVLEAILFRRDLRPSLWR